MTYENSYREYSEDDINWLKHIKVLRALDVPIADIKELKEKKITIDEISNNRKTCKHYAYRFFCYKR